MIALLSTIPGIIISIGIVGGTVVGGILFFAGVFDKKKKEERDDVDGQEDRLIALLKETETQLNKKLEKQKTDYDQTVTHLTRKIDELTHKMDHLEKENETLTRVLQGRDDQTQIFYKKAFEAMEVASRTYTLVETMNKNHTELMKILVDHLKPGVTINNQPQPNQPNQIIT